MYMKYNIWCILRKYSVDEILPKRRNERKKERQNASGVTVLPFLGSKMVKNGELFRDLRKSEIDEIATGQIIVCAIQINPLFRVNVPV